MASKTLISFILRSGLAVVFFYAAVASIINPVSWIGYIPPFLREILGAEAFLKIHAAGEIILALWLLCGKRAFEAALVSAAATAAIIVFNLGSLDIVFRDVAILAMAVALAVLEKAEAPARLRMDEVQAGGRNSKSETDRRSS